MNDQVDAAGKDFKFSAKGPYLLGGLLALTLLSGFIYWRISKDSPNANLVKNAILPQSSVGKVAMQNSFPVLAGKNKAAKDAFVSGGQYLCIRGGHTLLPQFNKQGQPHCPTCGGLMQVVTVTSTP